MNSYRKELKATAFDKKLENCIDFFGQKIIPFSLKWSVIVLIIINLYRLCK